MLAMRPSKLGARHSRGLAAFLACAIGASAAAQAPEIGVAYLCDFGNAMVVTRCEDERCDVELGRPPQLRPYTTTSPAGVNALHRDQHCARAPGGALPAAEGEAEPTFVAIVRPFAAALALAAFLAICAVVIARSRAGGTARAATGPAQSPTPSNTPARQACGSCSASGLANCPQCQGNGGQWEGSAWRNCWSCGGQKKIACRSCDGKGYLSY
jgi:hypothetical protein